MGGRWANGGGENNSGDSRAEKPFLKDGEPKWGPKREGKSFKFLERKNKRKTGGGVKDTGLGKRRRSGRVGKE